METSNDIVQWTMTETLLITMKEPSKSVKQRSRSSRDKLLSSRALKSHHAVDLTRWHLVLDFSAHGQQGTFSRNWWWSGKQVGMLQYCSGTGKKDLRRKGPRLLQQIAWCLLQQKQPFLLHLLTQQPNKWKLVDYKLKVIGAALQSFFITGPRISISVSKLYPIHGDNPFWLKPNTFS